MINPETLKQAKINEWHWQVVQAKDGKFDGAFFTGVVTTKIYCQPLCSAKHPKRENVTSFHFACESRKIRFARLPALQTKRRRHQKYGCRTGQKRLRFSQKQLEVAISRIFADKAVDYLHLRNAQAGCFIARIERLEES